jgi:hypothetical protein
VPKFKRWFAGSVIAMSLFSHKMKLADAIVGLMSCVSQVLSSTFYTFANSTLGMYIGRFFLPKLIFYLRHCELHPKRRWWRSRTGRWWWFRERLSLNWRNPTSKVRFFYLDSECRAHIWSPEAAVVKANILQAKFMLCSAAWRLWCLWCSSHSTTTFTQQL